MTLTMALTKVSNTENNNDTKISWAPTTRNRAKDLEPATPLDIDNTHLRYLPSFPHLTGAETDAESS